MHTLLKYTAISSRIEHVIAHKNGLCKFGKAEIISSIFSNHSRMKLGISNRRKAEKFTSMWKLNHTLLENHESTKKSK